MRSSMRAGIFVLVLFMSAGFLFAAGGNQGGNQGGSQQVYNLRFGHVLTEQDLFHKHYLEWVDAAKAASNGRLVIEVYANAQLGKEEDVLEQIRQGANIGWQTDFARLGSYVRELSVVNAPYFVSNLDEALKLKDSATIKKLNAELAEKIGIANISFDWVQGYRHVFSNVIAKSPAEMRGLRIRTAPAPIWVESVKALGCTATPLPYGEIYTGLQTKVVEGCELPYNAALSLNIQEVAKYVMETGHIFQLNACVVSSAWLNKLPADLQKILIDTANAAGLKASKALAAQTDGSKQTMVSKGMTVIPQKDLDMAGFIRDSAKAYDALNLSAVRASVYKDIGK